MIHFAIVNMNGEIEGQGCKIVASSSRDSFNKYPVPEGHRKVLLTFEEYEILSTDFDADNLICNCKVDLIESKVYRMTQEEKNNILSNRPEWCRDTRMPDGRIKREKKDGKVLEVTAEGFESEWRDEK